MKKGRRRGNRKGERRKGRGAREGGGKDLTQVRRHFRSVRKKEIEIKKGGK